MKLSLTILLAILILLDVESRAQEAMDSKDVRILVTFSDPGMSRSARAGPSHPGYARRVSSYLTSIGVQRTVRRIGREFGMRLVDDWPIVPLKLHCQVYAIAAGENVDEVLARLRSRPEVESAQRLNRFEVSGSVAPENADPFTSLQHNLETLEVAQAHAWSLGGGSSVTIVDTGADIHHPELKNRISDYEDYVERPAEEFSRDAHGTAVAGVIGAASDNGIGVTGVAPQARLTVLKSCWYADGSSTAVCNSFTLAKALSYAVESDTNVINLSLTGPSDALLGRLIRLAVSRGIIVVAAAPPEQEAGFPADVPGVIVVGGRTQENHPVTAPSDEILVPVPGGGFDYASGTSLSAAQVSGIVALLVAMQPQLTRDEIFGLLVESRISLDASVNACRALAMLLNRSGCALDALAKGPGSSQVKILPSN